MKPASSYGVCPECITYGKRLFGSEAGLCNFCKKVFCITCYMMIDKSHKCDSAIPLEVFELLGGVG